jgi:hypothetical protein
LNSAVLVHESTVGHTVKVAPSNCAARVDVGNLSLGQAGYGEGSVTSLRVPQERVKILELILVSTNDLATVLNPVWKGVVSAGILKSVICPLGVATKPVRGAALP